MDKYKLPPQTLEVGKVVDEINAYDGSRNTTDPYLDITGMVRRAPRLVQPLHTFRIRYKQWGKDRLGNPKFVDAPGKYVWVRDNYEAELLKRALANKFRELSGQEFSMEASLRAITTAVDPDDNNSGKPRVNTKPVASVGDVINSSNQIVTGENV